MKLQCASWNVLTMSKLYLHTIDDCRFNWSTQQLCENMGLRRFFE